MELKGWNEFLAARNLGINNQYLRNLLSLIEAPKEVKELVEEKKDFKRCKDLPYILTRMDTTRNCKCNRRN